VFAIAASGVQAQQAQPATEPPPVITFDQPTAGQRAAAGDVPGGESGLRLNIDLQGDEQPGQVSVAVQIILVMTLLSLAPSLIMLMTSFTRTVIVLGFV